jgi:hypothetical protein
VSINQLNAASVLDHSAYCIYFGFRVAQKIPVMFVLNLVVVVTAGRLARLAHAAPRDIRRSENADATLVAAASRAHRGHTGTVCRYLDARKADRSGYRDCARGGWLLCPICIAGVNQLNQTLNAVTAHLAMNLIVPCTL